LGALVPLAGQGGQCILRLRQTTRAWAAARRFSTGLQLADNGLPQAEKILAPAAGGIDTGSGNLDVPDSMASTSPKSATSHGNGEPSM